MGAIIESILAGIIVSGLFFMLEGAAGDIRNASLREKIDDLQSTVVAQISPIVHDLENSENRDRIEAFLKSDDVSELVQRILAGKARRTEDSLPLIQEDFNAVCSRYVDDTKSPDVAEKLWKATLDGCEESLKNAIEDEELKLVVSIFSIQNGETLAAVADTSRKIDEISQKTAEELERRGFGKNREPEYPIRNIKHPRNPNFTGREDLLQDLRQTLTNSRNAALIQTINGLGGVGKTQLAIEYAYRHLEDYDIIWWLRSEDPATIADDYARLAEHLYLPVEDVNNIPEIIEAVQIFLARCAGWLLIFDNAPDPDAIRQFLPATTTGHVLITSRHQDWQCATEFPIDTFERPESLEFIQKRTGQDDESAADELARELGDLPLALEQAGAFIKETGMPIQDYLEAYRKKKLALLERRKAFDYAATVATTWGISFQKIQEQPDVGQVASDLLNLCAFFAPDDIPLNVIIQGSEYLPPDLSQACQDKWLLYETIGVIREYSLIEKQDDFLSIHRLVQEVIRSRLDRDEQRQWAGAAVQILDAAFPDDCENPQTWPECSLLLPHVLSVAGHAEDLNPTQMELGRLLNQAGTYLRERAEPKEALRITKRALIVHENTCGTDHPEVARTVNNLGSILYDLGDRQGAKKHFEQALIVHENTYGTDHPEVAQVVNNLGGVLYDLGDLQGAKEHFERALKIYEKVYGTEHPEVARVVNNLGGVLRDLGDRQGAKEHFERALSIDEKVYGTEHPGFARVVNNLGTVLYDLGDRQGAKERFERTLKIYENTYGTEHPEAAKILNNLGGVLRDLGDRQGAKEHYERALSIDEKVYGTEHPEVARAVNNLGTVLKALGDQQGAKEHFERALKIYEKVYGTEHPKVAQAVNNLGSVLYDLGDLQGAKGHFERALQIYEKVYGKKHPTVKKIRKNLRQVKIELNSCKARSHRIKRHTTW
ncbi:FxSxx-COOH system tetratricopeptide repeat protein [Methanoculleus taiwanensis]|uniref:FxSxx-COOH system tetratricopeptide repeat protein n=1 Tax=Methanoculleus taiwanensis TaxID=1550565 RepID=UPI000FFEC21A|nr:FxSxx-COOH system tetratricopeptide repeat protein [Methanoculleus taiwanensis]